MSVSVSNRPHAPNKSESVAESWHPLMFNPIPRTLTWERLENMRLKNLGLGPNRYSRHFDRFQKEPTSLSEGKYQKSQDGAPPGYVFVAGQLRKVNSVAPFYTVGKPTCGFFFSRNTDNKKNKFGIPPSDLVKWRSFVN